MIQGTTCTAKSLLYIDYNIKRHKVFAFEWRELLVQCGKTQIVLKERGTSQNENSKAL